MIGLVPAPHQQDAVEVAAHSAGRTDQGVVTDVEGQGQGTGEGDFENAILFVYPFHLRKVCIGTGGSLFPTEDCKRGITDSKVKGG